MEFLEENIDREIEELKSRIAELEKEKLKCSIDSHYTSDDLDDDKGYYVVDKFGLIGKEIDDGKFRTLDEFKVLAERHRAFKSFETANDFRKIQDIYAALLYLRERLCPSFNISELHTDMLVGSVYVDTDGQFHPSDGHYCNNPFHVYFDNYENAEFAANYMNKWFYDCDED